MRAARLAAGVLAVLALAPPARATQTDPVLVVEAARALAVAEGTLVEVDARYPQPDLVQQPVAVQVLLRASGGATSYVRFELGGDAVAGTLASLANGLDPGDVAALLAGGVPLAGARLLRLAQGRIELWLPAAAAAQAGEVQLFLVYEGDPILSNPAPIEELP